MKKINFLIVFTAIVFLSMAADFTTTNFQPPSSTPYLPEVPFDYDIPFTYYIFYGVGWVKGNAWKINQNMTREKATLGRVLFYDKRLSVNDEISCSSCHKQEFAFADNQQFSEGINGIKTSRNVPNINDLGWQLSNTPPSTFLFWDARESDLEKMMLQPIANHEEMGMDMIALRKKLTATEFYPPLFEAAFGDAIITQERIGEALAQFVRSLNVFDSKYDMVKNGQADFTEAELQGEMLFKANCAVCHSSDHFGIALPVSNSLTTSDPGYAAVTGNSADIGKFRSPSLRNIELTAPYMHDGSMETLEEVLIFYSDSIPDPPVVPVYYNPTTGQTFSLGGIEFDETDIQNLVAFLKTLTSEGLVSDEKFSDPFRLGEIMRASELKQKFSISPNPVGAKTTIGFENPTNEQYDFRLKNINGQTLRTFSTQEAKVELERNTLPTGVYFLEIRKGERSKVEKLVVQ